MSAAHGEALAALLADRPISAAHWGLERIEALLRELGRPDRVFAAIHIAGTNGKGSTATFAASMLQAGGLRTGLYTSPHLADVRERFRVDGAWVEESILEGAAARVLACSAVTECTYFEATTALALLAFAEAGVEVAVIETGLGGRLDATNVLLPVGTAITPIGLEHTGLLGSTLEEIAGEKAGIIKPGVPVCVGRMPAPAIDAISHRAASLDAPFARLGEAAVVSGVSVGWAGTSFSYRSDERADGLVLQTSLTGGHQGDNAALALLTLDRSNYALEDAEVRAGIAAASVPGRFETWSDGGRRWVLDIAHNPPAMERLLATLRALDPPRPLVAVVGALADKDWRPMLESLALDSDAIILTQPRSAPETRRWDPAAAIRHVASFRGIDVRFCEPPADAVRLARELFASGTVLVTGSAYTVGDAGISSGVVLQPG